MEQGGGYRKVLQRQLLTLVSSRRAMAILLIATVITLNRCVFSHTSMANEFY